MNRAENDEMIRATFSKQAAVFDDAAQSYDADFSYSHIGAALREIVRQKLQAYLEPSALKILEINCGTGEDALYLASKGHHVLATDGSPEMIKIASSKKQENKLDLTFKQLDFNTLGHHFSANSFDVIFSNFGGLNCAKPEALRGILIDILALLKPGGKFIGVIMGTNCLWEKAYYLFKNDKQTALRRRQPLGVETTIGSSNFNTYYYSPATIKRMLPQGLSFIKQYPIGFFIPPTYAEHYFKKHTGQLKALRFIEENIESFGILANMADHFMIVTGKEIQ